MFRKTKISIILASLLAVGLFLAFTSCEHATPICPGDDDDGREFLGSSEGMIGDVSTHQKLYKDAAGQEIINWIVFNDRANAMIGEAELTAAEDLVKQINLQMAGLGKTNADAADLPGEMFIDLGNFILKIFVTPYPADPTKYEVILTNMNTGEFLSFLLAKSSLMRADPTQFIYLVATNAVVLCLGAQETIDDSQVCRENAPFFCGAAGVKRAYIEGRFSLREGCQSSCKIICGVHDQGGIGF
ncbi:hypothetical protein JXA02_14590 [candidate division KSB1 bacterium]|nr:hypothetical protein [candidate division KSB1 bacterium]